MLKHFSINIDNGLFAEDNESDEAISETVKVNMEAQKYFEEFCHTDRAFNDYYKQLQDEEEKKVIMTFAQLQYFTEAMHKKHKRLKEQLTLCQIFLASDMCHRDTLLKSLVEKEIKKLNKALEGNNIVDSTAKALNRFYKRKFPQLNKTDRSVIISNALHYLKIHKDERFMNTEEAKDRAYRKGITAKNGWKKEILGRLKDIID